MVKYAYRDARRYAERQGYTLKGTEKIWDSSIANIGISWVVKQDRSRLNDYFAAVYPPFWRRELDIEDINVIKSCIKPVSTRKDSPLIKLAPAGWIMMSCKRSCIRQASTAYLHTY